MHKVMKAAVAALLVTASPACASAQEDHEAAMAGEGMSDAQIQQSIETLVADLDQQGFSGFVTVARGGEPIAFAQAGAADPASGRAYDLDTQFDNGSLAKPHTGLAASKLIAGGRLDPDATLADFFDDVPDDKAGITVAHMLTHTAGLPDAHGSDFEPMAREEMFDAVFGAELIGPPGGQYAYSNTGFSLIAAIIEDITGKPYEDYLVEDVLRPLGMYSTGYARVYDDARVDASENRGPVRQASWGGLEGPSWALVGNGGMISTARDLVTLGQAILNGGLPEDIASVYLEPRVDEGMGDAMRYGYGIGWQDMPGLGVIHWHNGGNPHFQTEWWNFRDSGLTLLIHRNGGPVSMRQVLPRAIEAATGVDIGAEEDGESVDMRPATSPPDTPAGELAGHFLDAIHAQGDDAWAKFVETRMTSALLDQIPPAEHMAMLPRLRTATGGGEISAIGTKEGELHVELTSGGGAMTLVFMHTQEDGVEKLRGIGIL